MLAWDYRMSTKVLWNLSLVLIDQSQRQMWHCYQAEKSNYPSLLVYMAFFQRRLLFFYFSKPMFKVCHNLLSRFFILEGWKYKITFTGQVLSTYRVNCAVPSWNDLWYFFGPLPSAFLGGPNEPPQIRATGFRSEVILNPPFGIGPGKIWSLSNPQCSSYSMCDRVILIWKLWVQDISKLLKHL